MRVKIFLAIILLAAAFISCDKNVDASGCIGLGDSTVFKLKYGEKKWFCDGNSSCISFNKIISDSRCPSNAICVWAGTASIELATCDEEGGSITLEIHHPVDYTFNNQQYKIELTELNPYPDTDHPHGTDEYVATITVKKK